MDAEPEAIAPHTTAIEKAARIKEDPTSAHSRDMIQQQWEKTRHTQELMPEYFIEAAKAHMQATDDPRRKTKDAEKIGRYETHNALIIHKAETTAMQKLTDAITQQDLPGIEKLLALAEKHLQPLAGMEAIYDQAERLGAPDALLERILQHNDAVSAPESSDWIVFCAAQRRDRTTRDR